MGQTETASELAEETAGNKADVLRSLEFFDGEANASEVRRAGEIPSGSVNYHLRSLADSDLIEHVGWDHVGQGGQAKRWRLTAQGARVAGHLTDDQPRIDDLDEAIEQLDDHDDRLEELQDRHRENFDDVEEEIETLRSEFSDLKSSVNQLLDKLEDD